MSNEVASPVKAFSTFLDKYKEQMSLALPKHLNADRMARLAVSAFSSSYQLQQCTPASIVGAIMTAAVLGLEPNVNGQGYLIPYKTTCTFVPGWKGLTDLAQRSGRCSVWTGCVFEGDEFAFQLGDAPFIRHLPGDEDDWKKITHVYAVGRVKGSDYPVIEVWTIRKIWKHRERYNKVGSKHYSYGNEEMYARKIPLLQVLKYMPQSIELSNAIAMNDSYESGHKATLDGSNLVQDMGAFDGVGEGAGDEGGDGGGNVERDSSGPEPYPDVQFAKNLPSWQKTILSGKKTPDDIIAMASTKGKLSDKQIATIKASPVAEDAKASNGAPKVTYAMVADQLEKAKDADALATVADLIGEIPDIEQRKELSAIFKRREAELLG